VPPVRRFGSVRQRGRSFEASYWYNGRRHVAPTTFGTKSDARAYLSSVESDIRRGIWIDPFAGRIRVRELAEEWTTSNPSKRESTVVREELTLRLHVLPVMGEERIERVQPRDVQQLVNDWRTQHAPRTVKRNYEVLRAMFGYAVRNDWLARTPCRNIVLPSIDGTRRYELSTADVGRIATHLPERYRVMVWLGATLGLRWSEVAALRVGRLDLAEGQLSVTEAITRGISGRNVLSPPKSYAGRRTMYMPDVVTAMLATHLEGEGLSQNDADALVFTDDEGGALRYSNWRRRVWEPATAAAGCGGAGFHDLRRLNATTLVVEGVDVKTAQTRLGHTDPRVTLAIYASSPAAVDRAAADVIGDTFFGPDGTHRSSGERRPPRKRGNPK
jgi:integrase